MKKFLCLMSVLILGISLFTTGCTQEISEDSGKINIVAVNFPQYDFSREIAKDKANIKMLIQPGGETHTYEPAPSDIISIETSDVFLYIGGESDEWVESILETLDTGNTQVIRLMDFVDTLDEEKTEGMQSDTDYDEDDEPEKDEHIWTSPKNAVKMVNAISEALCKADKENEKFYKENTKSYIEKLNGLDEKFRDIVKTARRKELVFGDRFPLIYFTKEYGLKCYAAFPGCSDETEPSASTIAFLIDKVNSDHIPVVMKIELSNGSVAETVASATDTSVETFYSCHNLSKEQFDSGESYISMMEHNTEVLKKSLN